MRFLMTLALVASSTAAAAQVPTGLTTPGPLEPVTRTACWPSAHIDRVVVRLADGTIRRGVLLCLGPGALTLAETGRVGQYQLSEVSHVRKAADPAWDGAAKGASVSLVLLALCAGHCPGEVLLRTALGYGLLGLAIDAVDTHRETIFRGRPAKRIAFGVHIGF